MTAVKIFFGNLIFCTYCSNVERKLSYSRLVSFTNFSFTFFRCGQIITHVDEACLKGLGLYSAVKVAAITF